MAKTAVTIRKSQNELPAFMRSDIDAGKQNIERSDLEIPRIKLMQALSPELVDYDDLKAGCFFHTAAEKNLGSRFLAVPGFYEKRYILWNPRDSGGGILARADDGEHWSPVDTEFTVKLDKKDGGSTVKWKTAKTVQQSGLANWGTTNPADTGSPPAATLMYNYLLAFPDDLGLMHAVLTFQRSSIKIGRRFNTKLKTIRAPMFGLMFEFGSFTDSSSSGQDFFNVVVKGAGHVIDEQRYLEYKGLNQSFSQSGLNIRDIETLQDDDTAGDDEEPEEKAPAGKRAGGRPRY